MVDPKVTVIGAGSFFTHKWVRDLALAPGLNGGKLGLVDVDRKRLDLARKTTEKILQEVPTGDKWSITASSDRREVLPESDYVINTIDVAGVKTVKHDYEIPKKYGVDQCIGDTTGPGGIMKALRTVPVWIDILKDVEQLCPEALVLNYTNPMYMMTLAAELVSNLSVVGLCHSVQGTSRQIASYLEMPYSELEWECAGINHMSWFTRLERSGKDQYPELLERSRSWDIYENDPVRFEITREFGYFVTESSGHFSEYVPYFRKREDTRREYCREGYLGESGFYARSWPGWRKATDKLRKKWVEKGEIDKDLLEQSPFDEINLYERSNEYASYIIESHWNKDRTVIYGNFPNEGLISNLPEDGIVEVKALVDGSGFNPCSFGKLPEQLAGLIRPHTSLYKLTVNSILEEDREKTVRAFMLDPLTAAVSSPGKIRDMAEELFEAEKSYVPEFLTK